MDFFFPSKNNDELKRALEEISMLVQLQEENYEHLPKQIRQSVKLKVDKTKQDFLRNHDVSGKERKELRQKKQTTIVKHVQVCFPLHTELCMDVLKSICSILETRRVTLKYDILTNPYDKRNRALPLIVLCLGRSRFGADIDQTVAPIDGVVDKTTWILIIHNKQEHALPLGSTDGVLIDEKYERFAGFIDLAYVADKGLYRCSMNDYALARIASILQS